MKTIFEFSAIGLAVLIGLGAALATAAPQESNWHYSRIFNDQRDNLRSVTTLQIYRLDDAGARDIMPDRPDLGRDGSRQ